MAELGRKRKHGELGPVGLLEFMHQFEQGRGDYSRERHALVDRLSLATILKGIREQRRR